MKALVEVGARYAYAQRRGLRPQSGCIILNGYVHAACVLRIVASDDLKHKSGIHRRSCHGTNMVEGPSQRYHSPRAHASVGGLESDDTAVRCGDADGPTGIGTNSPVTEFRYDSGRRATRRATGVVSGIPRIANRTEIADQRTAAVSEFVQVQLAQHH